MEGEQWIPVLDVKFNEAQVQTIQALFLHVWPSVHSCKHKYESKPICSKEASSDFIVGFARARVRLKRNDVEEVQGSRWDTILVSART